MAVKVILFDMDNTLIDRQRIFREMLREKLSGYHTNVTKDELEQIVDELILWDNNGNQHRLVTFQQYVDKYKVPTTAKELNDYWNENSGKIIYVFEDAEETIAYLHQNYRLGIVSNGNAESQRRKIAKLPFIDVFEYSIVSGEIDIHKPDKGIFLKACEDMGVLPEECVFVGDNYRCDIEGALQAGMKPIWISPKECHKEDILCIEHLAELKKIL